MLTIIVLEIKERKNAQKVKKGIEMAEGHVRGNILPQKILKPENAISCILNIQICSKIYANYTCI
jgi:hypothetical protein